MQNNPLGFCCMLTQKSKHYVPRIINIVIKQNPVPMYSYIPDLAIIWFLIIINYICTSQFLIFTFIGSITFLL